MHIHSVSLYLITELAQNRIFVINISSLITNLIQHVKAGHNDAPDQNADWRLFHTKTHNTQKIFSCNQQFLRLTENDPHAVKLQRLPKQRPTQICLGFWFSQDRKIDFETVSTKRPKRTENPRIPVSSNLENLEYLENFPLRRYVT